MRVLLIVLMSWPSLVQADMKFAWESGCAAAKRIVELRSDYCPTEAKQIKAILCGQSEQPYAAAIKLSQSCAKKYEKRQKTPAKK